MNIREKLKSIVIKYTLLRMLFYRDFEVGKRYLFIDHAYDPFKKDKLIVEIKKVKGKWINYEHVGSTLWTDESMERVVFNFCYLEYKE